MKYLAFALFKAFGVSLNSFGEKKGFINECVLNVLKLILLCLWFLIKL